MAKGLQAVICADSRSSSPLRRDGRASASPPSSPRSRTPQRSSSRRSLAADSSRLGIHAKDSCVASARAADQPQGVDGSPQYISSTTPDEERRHGGNMIENLQEGVAAVLESIVNKLSAPAVSAVLESPNAPDLVLKAVNIAHTNAVVEAVGSVMDALTNAVAMSSVDDSTCCSKFLEGVFAPVEEEVEGVELAYEGVVPFELDGVYMRNGPNAAVNPVANYHWFDGEGMIHATRIKDGKLVYSSHFIKTYHYQRERKAGRPLFMEIGDMQGANGLLLLILHGLKFATGYLDKSQGFATANTALIYHAGRIMALHENDMPYQVHVGYDGSMDTVGRLQVQGWDSYFSAHPKSDPTTGNLHFFGQDFSSNVWLQYGELDSAGELLRRFPISLPYPTSFHDMAITENHVVLPHMPLCFDVEGMVKEGRMPFKFRQDLPSRFGILPKGASDDSDVKWFTFPDAFYCFHFANAWEEGRVIKVVGCEAQHVDLDLSKMDPEEAPCITVQYVLDLDSGECSRHVLCSHYSGDFPIINPHYTARKNQWAYVSVLPDMLQPECFMFGGIIKVAMDTPETIGSKPAKITLPDGFIVGEVSFVPRFDDPALCDGEDDGFLVTYATDRSGPGGPTSYFLVYDAKTMSSIPLVAAQLPHHIPPGMHGTWVSGQQLNTQVL